MNSGRLDLWVHLEDEAAKVLVNQRYKNDAIREFGMCCKRQILVLNSHELFACLDGTVVEGCHSRLKMDDTRGIHTLLLPGRFDWYTMRFRQLKHLLKIFTRFTLGDWESVELYLLNNLSDIVGQQA